MTHIGKMGQFEEQCQLLFPHYQGKDASTYACCVDNITPELMQNGVLQQKRHINVVCSRLAQEKQQFEASRDAWCTKLYPKHIECCKVNLTDDALHAAIAVSNRDDPVLGTVPLDMDPEAWVKPTGKESPEVKKQKENRKKKMDLVAKASEHIDKKCKMNIYAKRTADVGVVIAVGNASEKALALGKAVGQSMVDAPKNAAQQGAKGLRFAAQKGAQALGTGTEAGEATSAVAEAGEIIATTGEVVGGEVAADTVVAGTAAAATVAAPVVTAAATAAVAAGAAAADAAAAAALASAGVAANAVPGLGQIASVGLLAVAGLYTIKELEDE